MTTRLRYPLDLVLFAQKYLREEHPGEDFNDLALLNEALDDAKLGPLLRYSYKHNSPFFPGPSPIPPLEKIPLFSVKRKAESIWRKLQFLLQQRYGRSG